LSRTFPEPNMLKLLSPNFRVVGVSDEELENLFEALSRGGGGDRWIFVFREGGYEGIHGRTGRIERTEDPLRFVQAIGARGVLFEKGKEEGIRGRFPDVKEPWLVYRLLAYLAPLLPDFAPGAQGLNYNFEPSERNRMVIGVLRRFLPRNRSIVLSFPQKGVPYGLYLEFDSHRALEKVIGARSWPFLPRDEREIQKLGTLGAPVELGIYLTEEGMERILRDGLRGGVLKELMKKRELRLDPLPLALRMALLTGMGA